jgi:hypothetical protein
VGLVLEVAGHATDALFNEEVAAKGGPYSGTAAVYVAEDIRGCHEARLSRLLRECFGNPFRPVAIDPTWRTPAVVALAAAVYDERRFEELPILADALEEAGCGSADLLTHLRAGGEHALGCWAVDAVLGKS